MRNHTFARSLHSLLLAVAFLAQPAAAAGAWRNIRPQAVAQTLSGYLLVPVAGTVAGAGGTQFKTDLTIRNGLNSVQNVQLFFLPANQDNSVPSRSTVVATIEPFTTYTYDVARFWSTPGLGAVLIKGTENELGDNLPADPKARLDAAYRIYTPQPAGEGSMSQSSDAIDLTRSSYFPAGTVTGLRQDSSFRTNVGVVNLDPRATRTFHVTASGSSNRAVILDIAVPPMSMSQQPLPAGDLGQVTIRVELLNPDQSGNGSYWTAYGSSVDNITGDSWLQMISPD